METASSNPTDRAAIEAELRKLEHFADWMDSRFRLPGTEFRFGLDGLLGLVPGIGDSVTALPAAYIILRARAIGAPPHVQARMVGNVLMDLLIGAVPLVGDLFDFGFKANRRNVGLLREHFGGDGVESARVGNAPRMS
jgi:Domain of unknown function (DUF4112)